jgi:fused signal recognition particle receptor
VLLLLDAAPGQNAIRQVHVYKKMIDVPGLIVTKLDGSARGVIVVALAKAYNIPAQGLSVE